MRGLHDLAWRLGAPLARRLSPLRGLASRARGGLHLAQHTVAAAFPAVIRPHTVNLTAAITARCNQRCAGCLYERGFMAGQELPTPILRSLVDDAAELRVRSLRLYGGEPLLHRDLAEIVSRAVDKGLRTYVTTNGILLESKVDELFRAGLRDLTFGFYGVGTAYDDYVERTGNFDRLERGVATVRDRYGSAVGMRMNWLLMRPTCSVRALEEALAFARRYATPMQVDLIHYSLPYFTEGRDKELQFTREDRPAIEEVVNHLLWVKAREPGLIENTEIGIRAIPDWLLRGAQMRVPCDKYRMVWIGADGTVQLCYVTFHLGNLHEHRLADLLYTEAHAAAAQAAFRLDCPNCHCGFDERTRKHLPSRSRYSR